MEIRVMKESKAIGGTRLLTGDILVIDTDTITVLGHESPNGTGPIQIVAGYKNTSYNSSIKVKLYEYSKPIEEDTAILPTKG